MVWLKKKHLDTIEKLFIDATNAGDSLIAGELFDVILEVVHSAGRANENPSLSQLEKMQWERVAGDAKGRLEAILERPNPASRISIDSRAEGFTDCQVTVTSGGVK